MYKSYSYNNMPKAITEKPPEKKPIPKCEVPKPPAKKEKQGFLENLETDDIILIIVIAALLLEDCDDKLLLLALAFIFFGDLF